MEIISVKDVSKSFKRKNILEKINVSINKGEIVGLIGPSGEGKSVFTKILIGFFKPSEGKVEINSTSSDPIGFSMQDNSIYENITVRQNLSYFSKLYKIPSNISNSVIETLLENLGLKQYEKVLVGKISGGTKKRVDIACALLKNSEIIILDEPFVGLDPVLISSISEFILDLNKQGKTIIISSHRVDELSEICHRLLLVKNKQIKPIDKSQIKQAYT